MKKISPLLIAIVALVLVAGAWYYSTMKKPSYQPAPSELGKHCGGNMMNAPSCGGGYHCAPEVGSHLPFGDVGGTCVAD